MRTRAHNGCRRARTSRRTDGHALYRLRSAVGVAAVPSNREHPFEEAVDLRRFDLVGLLEADAAFSAIETDEQPSVGVHFLGVSDVQADVALLRVEPEHGSAVVVVAEHLVLDVLGDRW